MRVALMGGGTAGHLFPSVAVAQRLVGDMRAEVLFIGAEGRLDSRILAEQNLPHELIPARPFPYGLSPKALPALWALHRSTRRCKGILRAFSPDVVFGAGGYVSVAGILAAARLRVPSVCHVSDARPDRANRLLARWATRITAHFEAAGRQFPEGKSVVTGQPVRVEFLQATREEAREALGIPREAFVLLIAGGSQGARTLNYAALGALEELLKIPSVHIVHLTGSLDHEDIARQARERISENPRYKCFAFHEQPWLPVTAADLCLTRAGASSLAEMVVVGLPMMIVPYPYAAAHQRLNAAPLVECGGAIMVEDADLTPQWLVRNVGELREAPQRLGEMSDALRAVSRPRAADDIAQIIAQLAGE